MKTVQFLTEALGEYSDTARYIREVYNPVVHASINFDVMHPCIRNSDNWEPCAIERYALKDVKIPDWMEPENFSELRWMQYTRSGGREEFGKRAYEKLGPIDNERLLEACMVLLKTKTFRSSFRKSLRDQLDAWIEDDSAFAHPLTHNQYDKIVPRKWY